jgi:uncharacterized protein YijF (DUF1287 family)
MQLVNVRYVKRFPAAILGFGTILASGAAALVFFPQETPRLLAPKPHVQIQQVFSAHDEDGDGVNDTQDLLDGARAEVERQPAYLSSYYQDGYPPATEGVCTDLVWRAFKDAGYDLKDLVDADIQEHTDDYPAVDGKPDPNIDFRRTPNLDAFFKKYATSLTKELKPGDEENLKQWQGGDIVTFGSPSHIGIVSDKRDDNGVPLLIHNAGSALEDDGLLFWSKHLAKTIGHYRWPKE